MTKMTAAMMMSGAAMLHALGHSGYKIFLVALSLFPVLNTSVFSVSEE